MIGSIILLVAFIIFYAWFLFEWYKLGKEALKGIYNSHHWSGTLLLLLLSLNAAIWSITCMSGYEKKKIEQRYEEQTYNVDYYDIVYDSLYVQHNSVKDSTITFKIIEK